VTGREEPTKAAPAPATTVPEEQPAPWAYKEEPDIIPAEEPTGAAPAPPAAAREQQPAPPWSYQEGSQGDPSTWAYKEEPDVEGGAS
jgi:hypothetical protein